MITEATSGSSEAMKVRGDLAGFMQTVQQRDKTLWQKVRTWFQELTDKLKKAIDAYRDYTPDSPEGRMVEQMEDALEVLQEAFAEGLVDASENYQAVEGQKNTTREGGMEQYSIRRTSKMSLKEQLREFYKKTFYQSDSFYFGTTPKNLERSGLEPLPLAMGQDDFKKSTSIKHNIPRRVLLNTENNLLHPVFSFTAGKQVGIMTSDIDGDGKPVVMAIHGGHNMDRRPVNLLKSIYGVESIAEWIKDQINSGAKFRIYDIEKTNTMLQTQGYLAAVGADAGSWDIITPIKTGVNPESPENSGDGVLRSDRDPTAAATAAEIKKQNKDLEKDVRALEELLKAQEKGRAISSGDLFTVAEFLKKASGVTDSKQHPAPTAELAKLLGEFYGYIRSGEELSWNGISQKAQPVADWLRSHTPKSRERVSGP